MTRSTAYAYKVVITTEDEHTISIEFESPNQLSKHEQEKKARDILLAVYDDVETGAVDMEVQRAKVVLTDTTTEIDSNNTTRTQTLKTYVKG